MSETTIRGIVNQASPDVFDMAVLAGGEPSLVPHLITTAVKACRSQQIPIALSTAPVWARSMKSASSFLDKIPAPNFIILSLDKYHLEFLSMEHYALAVGESIKRGIFPVLNVCCVSDRDKEELRALISTSHLAIAAINFARVMPKGNAAILPEVCSSGMEIQTADQLDRLPRTCSIGNMVINPDGALHACCWSGDICDSPLKLAGDASVPGSLALLAKHAACGRITRNGFIDSLSDQDRGFIVRSTKGTKIDSECALCAFAMKDPMLRSLSVFSPCPGSAGVA